MLDGGSLLLAWVAWFERYCKVVDWVLTQFFYTLFTRRHVRPGDHKTPRKELYSFL